MKTFSLVAVLASFFLCFIVLCQSVVIKTIPLDGLVNPVFRIDLLPGRSLPFLLSLLALLINLYFFSLVAWVDVRTRPGFPEPQCQDTLQEDERTLQIRLIKDAIRSADFAALKNLVDRVECLPASDEDCLSPLELAELYGNEPIIELVKSRTISGSKHVDSYS